MQLHGRLTYPLQVARPPKWLSTVTSRHQLPEPSYCDLLGNETEIKKQIKILKLKNVNERIHEIRKKCLIIRPVYKDVGDPIKAWERRGVKTKTNLATLASGEVKMAAKHETTPACYIFYLTKHSWACYEIILPEQRLAISSRTFFLKNIVHKKVKFGHFVQLIAPTDRWIATYLCFKLLNSGERRNLWANFKISFFLCFES